LDVINLHAFQAAAHAAKRRLGPIDVLCSNTGVVGAARMMTGLPGIEPADLDWLMRVNMTRTSNTFKTMLPRMLSRETEGHIVVTESISGIVPQADAPLAYTPSAEQQSAFAAMMSDRMDADMVGAHVVGRRLRNIKQTS
jgi:NADP-dependent 3-hydroxy acid dehydrogenase YdfG